MEREGRGRRGIIVGGMILGLLLGCNNGAIEELEKKNKFLGSVVNLGNEFLSVFTSFGDMVGGVLGFDTKTTKSQVGEYFKKVKKTVEGTRDKLNTMVENMKSKNNPNAEATDGAVKKLINETLDKIIAGASDAIKGAEGNDPIVDISVDTGAAGDNNAVKSLSEGIGKIVSVVLKEGEGQANAGDAKNPGGDSAVGNARNAGDGNAENGALALFAKKAIADSSPGVGKASKDAAKAVGAVTGADILQAISEGESGNAAKLAKHNNTLSEGTPIAASDAKDATIAGGMALRAMAKGGKFANRTAGGGEEAEKQIQNAAVSAVNKALDTLTIAIRKTIGEGLKSVKDAMKLNTEGENTVASDKK